MSPPPPAPPLIDVQDLYKSFNGFPVLKGVNLKIPEGTTTVILGGSGSGKTVLMKHIMGLFKPDSGQVIVDGQNVSIMSRQELAVFRQRMGMVFQSAALFDSMTVADNVAFPLRERLRLPRPEISKRVEAALVAVGLEGMGAKNPAEVSGGMRKRVAIARALVTEPEIVFFDEPTTGLDPVLVNTIHHLILDLHRRYRFTAVMVSHEIPEIFEIADTVAMLHEGRIVEVGPPAAIQASQNRVVRQFIRGVPENSEGA